MDRVIAGPCVICGDKNYPLSMGGPTICPSCDCGPPNPRRVREERERLLAEIERLRRELDAERRELDAERRGVR